MNPNTVSFAVTSPSAEPFVACTYGPSGIGKTTDMGYSFPRALFLAAPGSLSSIQTVCGYIPERVTVNTIPEATALIEKVGQSRDFDTIVIDDFSFMAEQTFAMLETKYSGFRIWGEMRNAALAFRDKSRYCGVNVALNCWEQPPKTKPDGSRVRGGPQLSGKLPEQIPALCDVVLRGVHEPHRRPWPAAYRCSADPNYVMKDRFNIATLADPAPMNLAEILRAAGHVIPRHPSYEEQEAQVEKISSSLSGNVKDDTALCNEIYTKLIEGGKTVAQARWTLRDALDRAVIRRSLTTAANTFLMPSTTLM
jgi:hypothetical protein